MLTTPHKGFSGSTGSTESDGMQVKTPTAAAIRSMCDLGAPQTHPNVIDWESILRREEDRSTQRKTLGVKLKSTETQPTYELNLGHKGGKHG